MALLGGVLGGAADGGRTRRWSRENQLLIGKALLSGPAQFYFHFGLFSSTSHYPLPTERMLVGPVLKLQSISYGPPQN